MHPAGFRRGLMLCLILSGNGGEEIIEFNQKLEFLMYCLLPSFLRESPHQEVLPSSLSWDSSLPCRTKGEPASLGDLACLASR